MDEPIYLRADGLVTSEQAAELCGVARKTIWAWVNRGLLAPAHKDGHQHYYNLIDLARAEATTRLRARRTLPPLPDWEVEFAPEADTAMLLRQWAAQADSMVADPSDRMTGASESIVYYARFADRIKIGTTTRPKHRLEALAVDALLATEPGDRDLERARHRQFAEFRIYREWFRPEPLLLEHIASLGHAPLANKINCSVSYRVRDVCPQPARANRATYRTQAGMM